MSADDDLRQEDIEAALKRAAKKAREIAAQTGTPLVVVRNGCIVEVDVSTEEVVTAKK